MRTNIAVSIIVFLVISSSVPLSLLILKETAYQTKQEEVINQSPSISRWETYDRVFETEPKTIDANIRIYHAPYQLEMLQGQYARSDKVIDPTISDTEFGSLTSLSDNVYGHIIPEYTSEIKTVDNYYLFPLEIQTETGNFEIDFAHWLSPQPDMYLAFDTLSPDLTNMNIVTENNVNDISKSVFTINDIYLLPSVDYYEFQATDSASFSVSTGGISLYNESIYQLYEAFQIYDFYYDIPVPYRPPLESWLDQYYYYEPYGLLLLVQAIGNAMNLPENAIFYEQIRTMTTYQDFLFYMNVDLTKGLQVFSHFNPNFIREINGIISLEFDVGIDSTLESYGIDAWNYYSESWIPIYTRTNTNNILTSGRLLDEFVINTNAWQFINDPNSNTNQFRWRVRTESTGRININFGGLWTKCQYDLLTFDLDVYFKVPDLGITKSDLYAKPELVLEYTTEGLQDSNEKINVFVPLANQTGDPKDYYVMLLPQSDFPPSPLRDARRGYPIPDHIVQEDTSIHLRIRGVFSRYTQTGQLQKPLISFDKISVKYQYFKHVNITDYALVSYRNLNFVDHLYVFNVSNEIDELVITHPAQYQFLANGLQLVEGPDRKDITKWWLSNPSWYGENYVNLTRDVIYFEGYGEYRFWFRSANYLLQTNQLDKRGSRIVNATYQLQKDFSDILITVPTSFQALIGEFHGLNGFSRMSSAGNFTIIMTGYNKYTFEKESTQYQGIQTTYSVINPKNPDEIVDKHNLFEYNKTFQASDKYFGEVLVEYLWKNEDGSKIGYDQRWVNIPSYSFNTPYSYFVTPSYTIFTGVPRWGVLKNNTVIVYSSHPNTFSVKINITYGTGLDAVTYHENLSLYNYEQVFIQYNKWRIGDPSEQYTTTYKLIYENGGLPELPNAVPSDKYVYYWIRPILTSEIDDLPQDLVSGYIPFIIEGCSEASFFPDFYAQYNFKLGVNLVFRPFFIPDQVYPVPIDTYLTIGYQCLSNDIEAIEIWINQTIQEDFVYTINRSVSNERFFLQRGYHYFNLPYQFAFAGNYSVKFVVHDTFGNIATYYTNRFYIESADDRDVIWKILDSLVEITISWIALISGGFVMYWRKKEPEPFMTTMPDISVISDPFSTKAFYER